MNGNDDLISVVVPAHNAERFIAEALASVQAQSHRNLEVVVVDDGSTDRTAEIVEAIASRDGRVRLIGTPRRGVSAARNLAIARARGDLIAPLDADDLWLPQKLARQYAKLGASSSEVGVVYCWSCGIDANGLVIMPSWGRGTACGDVLEEAIVQGVLGHSGTPLIRRTAFDETGGGRHEPPPLRRLEALHRPCGRMPFRRRARVSVRIPLHRSEHVAGRRLGRSDRRGDAMDSTLLA